MSKIDEKAKTAAHEFCKQYWEFSYKSGLIDDAIAAYEAAKKTEQPDECRASAFAKSWKDTNGGTDEPSANFWHEEGWNAAMATKRESTQSVESNKAPKLTISDNKTMTITIPNGMTTEQYAKWLADLMQENERLLKREYSVEMDEVRAVEIMEHASHSCPDCHGLMCFHSAFRALKKRAKIYEIEGDKS